MPTPITVVVPTHGRSSLLARTLESVAACERPLGYAGCLIVENGESGEAATTVEALARAHPEAGFQYLHHTRANKSAALNAALATLEGNPLVVYLDDDVRVAPGILSAYAAVAERSAGPAFYGGPLACDYEVTPPPWLFPALPHSARGFALDPEAPAPEVFLGANWAVRARDVLVAGGFDPNYGPGSPTGAVGQETDMQRRLKSLGAMGLFVPEARVWHYVPAARCSPRWAVGRRFRNGILAGRDASAERRSGKSPSQTLSGSVVGILRCAASLAKRAALRDRPGCWLASGQLAFHAGALTGLFRDR